MPRREHYDPDPDVPNETKIVYLGDQRMTLGEASELPAHERAEVLAYYADGRAVHPFKFMTGSDDLPPA